MSGEIHQWSNHWLIQLNLLLGGLSNIENHLILHTTIHWRIHKTSLGHAKFVKDLQDIGVMAEWNSDFAPIMCNTHSKKVLSKAHVVNFKFKGKLGFEIFNSLRWGAQKNHVIHIRVNCYFCLFVVVDTWIMGQRIVAKLDEWLGKSFLPEFSRLLKSIESLQKQADELLGSLLITCCPQCKNFEKYLFLHERLEESSDDVHLLKVPSKMSCQGNCNLPCCSLANTSKCVVIIATILLFKSLDDPTTL